MLLEWRSFPSNFQAQNFSLPNLVVLRLQKTDEDETNIDAIWTGWKGLLGSKLKFLDLSSFGGLTRTPDLSACLGLEVLVLHYNKRLIEIDSSIGKLEQLLHLEIEGSPNLRGLPHSLGLLKRMEKLIVNRQVIAEYQVKFHLPFKFDNFKSLRHLAIEYLGLESLPEEIGQLKLLKYLSLASCNNLRSLPESLWELESLVELNLMDTGFIGFSGKIGSMKELKVLNLSRTKIRTLPEGIGDLVKLKELDLSGCRELEQIPSEIGKGMKELNVLNLSDTKIRTLPEGIGDLVKLEVLDLSGCRELEQILSEIGNLFSLRILKLSGTGIVELPSSVIRLSRLQRLNMNPCWNLIKVEKLPTSLSHLRLPYFSLQVAPDLSNLVNIVRLEMQGAPITDDEEDRWTRFRSFALIESFPKLKSLVIDVKLGRLSCSVVQFLSQLPHNLSKLILTEFWATTLDLSLFPNLSELCINGSSSDEIELRGLEVLGNLQNITVDGCKSLARLSISSCPKELKSLCITFCPKLVEVEGVSRLELLQTLWILGCPSLSSLSDLSNLVKMKRLWMDDCVSIERMPALPRTEIPFHLHVRNCGKLRDFWGDHDLYVDIIEGDETDRCVILRRWIKCISELFQFCFCFPQNDFKEEE